jgi:hypothetical protein
MGSVGDFQQGSKTPVSLLSLEPTETPLRGEGIKVSSILTGKIKIVILGIIVSVWASFGGAGREHPL